MDLWISLFRSTCFYVWKRILFLTQLIRVLFSFLHNCVSRNSLSCPLGYLTNICTNRKDGWGFPVGSGGMRRTSSNLWNEKVCTPTRFLWSCPPPPAKNLQSGGIIKGTWNIVSDMWNSVQQVYDEVNCFRRLSSGETINLLSLLWYGDSGRYIVY